ncbi:hypothetical protein CRI94_00390 [Longibacter salinarum]|uniref:DUF1232 domain-containing protein n=1 Tax=Longibacter salinarum TaxID=1850348 RepID=A0A2A8D1E8_9BACT|nr:YkvA family protein [Longibacter salinarum]PEN14789.1 hypothetical protein CRI94_00390 [Longibacter salinarum]
MSSHLSPLPAAPDNHRDGGTLAPSSPPALNGKQIIDTITSSARTVLERRFRVLMLVRDAYDRLIDDAPALRAVLDDLHAMLRLLLAWANSTYRHVPWSAIMMVVGAVIYFVMPVDLVPDFLGPVGLMDDAAVIATVVRSVREELDRFRVWENGKSLPEVTGIDVTS